MICGIILLVMKMKAKYIITLENKQEIEAARKKNKDKNVEKRLLALSLRSDGKTLREIAEITGYNCRYVGDLVEKYCKNSLAAITENHYKGNRRNMSYQEEQDFLNAYQEQSEDGQLVDTANIRQAYEERVGHRISSGQIYRVFRRHGWRKVMPRSKHPKKASEEVIETSKKLTQR